MGTTDYCMSNFKARRQREHKQDRFSSYVLRHLRALVQTSTHITGVGRKLRINRLTRSAWKQLMFYNRCVLMCGWERGIARGTVNWSGSAASMTIALSASVIKLKFQPKTHIPPFAFTLNADSCRSPLYCMMPELTMPSQQPSCYFILPQSTCYCLDKSMRLRIS
jgi:hypothetical protein